VIRAARIGTLGAPPDLAEVDSPSPAAGEVLVDVRAVALNPVDIACGTGAFYGGHPPLPYVPGAEAVGDADGRHVYVFGAGLGIRRDGTLAEVVSVPEDAVYAVPDGIDDARAVAAGVAGVAGWLPVTARAAVTERDRVLILGATGTAGSVALQAARLRGASRIVAAGRRPERLERARELGADATVRLDESEDLAAAFAGAFGAEGPNVVIDFLWGAPFAAALEAAAPGALAVHVGQSAGAASTLRSPVVRGKQLEVLGYSNFALSHEAFEAGYTELLEEVASGRVEIDVETFPLERVAEAWQRQASGRAPKVVVEM
jgi:NADPH2:quinone reductase